MLIIDISFSAKTVFEYFAFENKFLPALGEESLFCNDWRLLSSSFREMSMHLEIKFSLLSISFLMDQTPP